MKSLVLLAVAGCLFGTPALAADCQPLTIVTSLPATRDQAGGITVPATLDGHDATLLIDTGGIYNLVSASAASEMNLERRALNHKMRLRMGVNGEALEEGVIVHDFKLGNIVAQRMQFAIIPDGLMAAGVTGTLGPSTMANYDLEIDPARGKVNLFSQQHCPGQVVYWTRSAFAQIPMRLDSFLHIVIPVQLDGHAIEAEIDTGSSTSWMSYDDAAPMFNWKDDEPGLVAAERKSPDWYRYPFQSLSLNGVDVRNPAILIKKNADRRNNGGPTLIIGMDVLSKLHTYFSFADGALFVTGADAQ